MCDLAQQSNADTQVHPRQEQKPGLDEHSGAVSMNVLISGRIPWKGLPRWMKRKLPSWHTPEFFLLFSLKRYNTEINILVFQISL